MYPQSLFLSFLASFLQLTTSQSNDKYIFGSQTYSISITKPASGSLINTFETLGFFEITWSGDHKKLILTNINSVGSICLRRKADGKDLEAKREFNELFGCNDMGTNEFALGAYNYEVSEKRNSRGDFDWKFGLYTEQWNVHIFWGVRAQEITKYWADQGLDITDKLRVGYPEEYFEIISGDFRFTPVQDSDERTQLSSEKSAVTKTAFFTLSGSGRTSASLVTTCLNGDSSETSWEGTTGSLDSSSKSTGTSVLPGDTQSRPDQNQSSTSGVHSIPERPRSAGMPASTKIAIIVGSVVAGLLLLILLASFYLRRAKRRNLSQVDDGSASQADNSSPAIPPAGFFPPKPELDATSLPASPILGVTKTMEDAEPSTDERYISQLGDGMSVYEVEGSGPGSGESAREVSEERNAALRNQNGGIYSLDWSLLTRLMDSDRTAGGRNRGILEEICGARTRDRRTDGTGGEVTAGGPDIGNDLRGGARGDYHGRGGHKKDIGDEMRGG